MVTAVISGTVVIMLKLFVLRYGCNDSWKKLQKVTVLLLYFVTAVTVTVVT